MGDIAEMMMDGALCQGCGEVFDDCETPGYPRNCSSCVKDTSRPNLENDWCTRDPISVDKTGMVRCPRCNRRLKEYRPNGYMDPLMSFVPPHKKRKNKR